MRIFLMALVLAACSGEPAKQTAEPAAAEAGDTQSALAQMPRWEEARAAGVDFRAVGQEPGWLLDIYQQDRIVLLWDYGENIATFPLSEPAYPVEGTVRYETQAEGRTLAVTIRRFPCQDAMSGEDYAATVEVVIDGRVLSGCGRSV